MNEKEIEVLLIHMREKSNEELLEILSADNRDEWREEALEAANRALVEKDLDPVVTNSQGEAEDEISHYEEEFIASTRHKSVRFLAHFSNVIGWIFVITIIGIPIGLSLLLFGHMALASIETEHNTRESANYLEQVLRELKNN